LDDGTGTCSATVFRSAGDENAVLWPDDVEPLGSLLADDMPDLLVRAIFLGCSTWQAAGSRAADGARRLFELLRRRGLRWRLRERAGPVQAALLHLRGMGIHMLGRCNLRSAPKRC
jgi:hypothetical protein